MASSSAWVGCWPIGSTSLKMARPAAVRTHSFLVPTPPPDRLLELDVAAVVGHHRLLLGAVGPEVLGLLALVVGPLCRQVVAAKHYVLGGADDGVAVGG